MRRTLLLLLGLLTANVDAASLEERTTKVSEQILQHTEPQVIRKEIGNGRWFEWQTNLQYFVNERGYSAAANVSKRLTEKGDEQKQLTLTVSYTPDGNLIDTSQSRTIMEYQDLRTNGPGYGDKIMISHRTSENTTIHLDIQYTQKGMSFSYRVQEGETEISTTFSSEQLHKRFRKKVGRMLSIFEEGFENLYARSIEEMEQGNPPPIPIEKIHQAMTEIAPLLPAARDGSVRAISSLQRQIKTYETMVETHTTSSAPSSYTPTSPARTLLLGNSTPRLAERTQQCRHR